MRYVIVFAVLLMATAAFAGTSTEWDGQRAIPSTPYSYVPDSGLALTNVAIFRDNLPWGSTADDDILVANAIAFTVYGSGDIGSVDLSPFDKVIISNQQAMAFNNIVSANAGWFDTFASGGGVVLLGMAHYFGEIGIGSPMPGGFSMAAEDCNNVVTIMDTGHEVFNVPNAITDGDIQGWNCSTHGDINVPGGGMILLQNADLTLGAGVAEVAVGAGRVIASAQPYQFLGSGSAMGQNLVLYDPQGVIAVENQTLSDVKALYR